MTKTLQDRKAHHIVQLPSIANMYSCAVRVIRALFVSRPLPLSAALLAVSYFPHNQIIDTHIRDALRQVLRRLSMSPLGHGFHAFRRSGATFCFNKTPHGLWRSSAVWSYLQNSSEATSVIPLTFSAWVWVWCKIFKLYITLSFKIFTSLTCTNKILNYIFQLLLM